MAQSRIILGPVESGMGDLVGKRFSTIHAFTTSGTSVTVKLPFTKIAGVSLTPIGAVAVADGALTVDKATGSGWSGTEATLPVDADGTVTVSRVAGTTSGLQFMLNGIGFGM